jgi:hypothetical protein
MKKNQKLTRRDLLKGMAAGACLSALPWSVRAQDDDPTRFLIVLTATGGASIIDAMLAIRASESNNASVLNTFPDQAVQQIAGTPFRAIDTEIRGIGPLPYIGASNQSNFVTRHAQDMMVVTHTGTSVNHLTAEKRSITGNDAWAGQTLQEVVATAYGSSAPIPNVNMGVGGFVEPGVNSSVPGWARGQVVADARLFFAGLDGSRGIRNAPSKALIERARQFRNEQLDERSIFARTFGDSEAIQLWKESRAKTAELERADLITKLNVLRDSPTLPLEAYGLATSPDAARVMQAFPLLNSDPFEAQAALAYLLIKNRVSVTVTIGPGLSPLLGVGQIVDSPPLAYDFSHTAHRATQAVMWHRLLDVTDRLIGLLKQERFGEGQSLWDRSLVYVATDFGRTKNRPEGSPEFGSGHDLNNGSLIISPMANGGRVLGGVNADTALTYGFDPMTGAPDPGRTMSEPEIYAGILQALRVDTAPGDLPSMPSMVRA